LIPDELKDWPQWILWNAEEREGKATKIPCDAAGRPVPVNEPSSWHTYDAAVALAHETGLTGIGFCFTVDDPFFGIDLDNCWPNMSDEAKEIAAKLQTYAEISPSGRGIKFIGKGSKGDNLRAKTLKVPGLSALEAYDRDRFFTITGNVWGLSEGIENCQEGLDWIMERWLPLFPTAQEKTYEATEATEDDQVVIDRMLGFANGDKARKLYEGDEAYVAAIYNGDDSTADLALAGMIAFAAGGPHHEQIERIFSSSARGKRGKWADRKDYRDRTIGKVLSEATQFYTPPAYDFGEFKWDEQAGEPSGDRLETSWTSFIDIVAVGNGPRVEPEIGGLAYKRQRNLWSGASEAGKTWAAVWVAVQEIRAGRDVVWIDTDGMGERAMLERVRAFGATDDEIRDHFKYIVPSEKLTPDMRNQILADTVGDLVVVDSFNATMSLLGLDFNSGDDVNKVWAVFDAFCRAGRAVIFIDHVTKAAEGRGPYAIGSERKHSGAFSHLRFSVVGDNVIQREGEGKSKITTNKDRGAYFNRPEAHVMHVTMSGGTGTLELREGGGDFRPTGLMEKVWVYVNQGMPDGVSKTQIENGVTGDNSAKAAARDALLEDGYLLAAPKPGRGGGTIYTVGKPYSRLEDEKRDDGFVDPTPTGNNGGGW
jgi:putative DNA primase/helicase